MFLIVFFAPGISNRKVFGLSLIASLGTMNRLDLALVFLPALCLSAVEISQSSAGRLPKTVGVMLLGSLPLIAWLLFSLFYYGFFIPNTAYAKLSAGIPQSILTYRGMMYFLSSLSLAPLTLLTIMLGTAAAVFSKQSRSLAVATGLALYLGYVVFIGGDFMNGRYFTVPFLCAILLLCRSDTLLETRTFAVLLGAVFVVGFASPYPPVLSDEHFGADRDAVDLRGVADERAFYYPTTGLLRACRNCDVPTISWAADGLAARENGKSVAVKQSSGFFGFYAGPNKRVVDVYGLLDPLLARLSIPDVENWRIGHYVRRIPAGYLETLESGENRIENPQLAEYYGHLALITRGDLFDPRRLLEIVKMNFGLYDHLLADPGAP